MTYSINLPNITREGATAVEQHLLGVNGVDYVDIDVPSETATVTSTLTYGEVLEAIRETGLPAK